MNANKSNKKPGTRNGEKNIHDNVPIRFNDWRGASTASLKDLLKTALVKFTVLTNNHGMGARNKTTANTSFGSIIGRRLDRIEDNPKQVIETWQSI